MAEQAQNEPTMEEILSSIRKIIADDDASAQQVAPDPEPEVLDVPSADEVVFEDDDLLSADAAPIETEEDVLAAISQSMDEASSELEADAAEAAVEEEVFDFDVEEDSFEAFEEEAFEGVEDFAEAEEETTIALEATEVEDTFEPIAEPEPEPAPAPVFEEEKPMAAQAAPLTDTATVTAAAGALSKLLSNVEFGEEAGGATTIEGLVREMMRPMLKEWLDENLPGIVEKQVEAEVQRIARMAG